MMFVLMISVSWTVCGSIAVKFCKSQRQGYQLEMLTYNLVDTYTLNKLTRLVTERVSYLLYALDTKW